MHVNSIKRYAKAMHENSIKRYEDLMHENSIKRYENSNTAFSLESSIGDDADTSARHHVLYK